MIFKGLNRIFFYSLPIHPRFFMELITQLTPFLDKKQEKRQKIEKINISALFDQYDGISLSRFLDENIAIELVNSKKPIYKFLL